MNYSRRGDRLGIRNLYTLLERLYIKGYSHGVYLSFFHAAFESETYHLSYSI